jgi:polygalacturonase
MREFHVKDFSAVGDGTTLNTSAIQSAIDACAATGGGRVIIGEGKYMSGSITLRTGVDLHIEQDGILFGSPNCEDYPEKQGLRHVESDNLPRTRNASFIFAEECENISITGMGKIDCNGTSFVRKKDSWKGWEYERIDAPTPPRVVFFTGCKNVRVENVTMVNQPAGWSYWIHDCDYVTFDKCKIFAEVQYPNNDGIHINSCRNVTISNCDITCGDDCIIVRANNRSLAENKVCERVSVTNCNLTSYACGIRIAWINDGTIRNCVFSNIVMTDTNTGICIQLPPKTEEKLLLVPDRGREATLVENLSFSNIVMDGLYAPPIKIILGQGATMCNAVRDVYFDNVHAKGLCFPLLVGRPDKPIENVTMTNCTFLRVTDAELPDYKLHGAADWDRSIGEEMFRHVKNIVLNNTSFTSY